MEFNPNLALDTFTRNLIMSAEKLRSGEYSILEGRCLPMDGDDKIEIQYIIVKTDKLEHYMKERGNA